MFCPLGYTTIKKMWEINRDAFCWDEMDLSSFFESVFELDKGVTSTWMAKTLSTDELIEKVILEVAFEGGLFLSSPAGKILKIDVPFFVSGTKFHHIVNTTPDFFSDEFNHSEPTCIDPRRLSEISEKLDQGVDPWWELRNRRGFCSINYYYDRSTYCISSEVYRRLDSVSHGYMCTATLRVSQQLMEPLQGLSICVTDKVAEQLSPKSLFHRFRLKALCEALRLNEKEFELKNQGTTNSIGRPKISDKAAEAFLRHFSIEDRPSWKEAINRLQIDEGLNVSVRTLQRGLNEVLNDKKQS